MMDDFIAGILSPERQSLMRIPLDHLELVSTTYQAMKGLTLEVIAHCHNPDYETMMDEVRSYFSKLEEEAFQLSLFEEPSVAAY